MPVWVCAACANHYPETDSPPQQCVICTDERQWVPSSGQRWTTLEELAAGGHKSDIRQVEPGLLGVGANPQVAIGQRGLVIQTAEGNLLWDPPGFLDEQAIQAVSEAGGLRAVTASHPHFYGTIVEWSHAFGAEILLPRADAHWLTRPDPAVRTWSGSLEILPGVTLVQCGGHFPGSAVAHFVGADGRGVVLSGDTVAGTPDEHWVSFMRSFPNKIPLSAAVVAKVADRMMRLDFDRLYDNFGGQVLGDAASWVRRSADRYIAWVSGEFDHLTG